MRRIRELEQKGVRTEVLSVSSGPEYEQAVSRVKDQIGPIGGVLHAAGAVDLDHPAFIRKTREQMMPVVEPKTDGLDSFCIKRCTRSLSGFLRCFLQCPA